MEGVTREVLERGVAAGAVLFDVRPQPQPVFGLAPQPLSLEAVQRSELPAVAPDTPVYLVCERGLVSELAGLYLEAAGFAHVYHLAGGTKAWPE